MMLPLGFHWRTGRVAMLALACASSATLSARAAETFDPMSQVGPNPILPPLQQYLLPPMHLARVVGWRPGEMPTVAAGLKIEPLAQNLAHPRSVYVLPNGDILVVEFKIAERPADRTAQGYCHGLRRVLGDIGRQYGGKQSHHAPAQH